MVSDRILVVDDLRTFPDLAARYARTPADALSDLDWPRGRGAAARRALAGPGPRNHGRGRGRRRPSGR